MLGFRRRLEREGRAARGRPHSFPSAQGPQSRTAAVLGSRSPVPRVWAGPQPSVRGRRASAIPVRAFQSSIACPRRGLVTFGASPGCCGRLCRAAPHSSPREARASALPGLHERRAGARGLRGHCRLMAGIFPELAVASRWLSPAGLCSWACRRNLSKAARTPETSREEFSSSFSCFSHRWFLANEVLYLRSYLSLDLQTLQQEGWQQLVCGVLGHLCAKRCAEPWVEATHFLSDLGKVTQASGSEQYRKCFGTCAARAQTWRRMSSRGTRIGSSVTFINRSCREAGDQQGFWGDRSGRSRWAQLMGVGAPRGPYALFRLREPRVCSSGRRVLLPTRNIFLGSKVFCFFFFASAHLGSWELN